jgi:hypothetical protein
MGQALGGGGSGAGLSVNPLTFLCKSPLATLVNQVYLLLRTVAWIGGMLADLFGTVFFQILFPAAQYVFTFLGAFINFMIGLLFGEFRIEFSIFLPALILIGTFILWLLAPTFGCFIENVLAPFARNLVPLIASLVPVIITIINVLFRVWNALVPLIGMIINIVIELFVVFFALFTSILGSVDVYKLFDAIFTIAIQLVMVFVNLLDGIVAIVPTMLAIFASVIGYCMTIIIESAPTLIPVVVWLVKIVFFVLVNLLGVIVKLCRAFSGGRLRDEPGYDRMPSYDAQGNDDMFENARPAAQKYFTAESAELGAEDVEMINRWNVAHPPGTYSYYHSRTGVALTDLDVIHDIYDTVEQLKVEEAPDRFDDEQDYAGGWTEEDGSLEEIQKRSAHPHMRRSVPEFADHDNEEAHKEAAKPKHPHDHVRHHMRNSRIKAKHLKGHFKVTDRPIHLDYAEGGEECKSKFCGGHGKKLRHAHQAVNADHDYSEGLFGFEKMSHDHHRAHVVYTTSALHVVRRTMHHMVNAHWHNGDGSMRRHFATAFKHITGHETPHDMMEHMLTQDKHPIDSLHTYIPVVHNLPGIRWLSKLDPEPETLHQNWMDEREVFYAENTEDDPLHALALRKRNLMQYVTKDTKADIHARRARQAAESAAEEVHEHESRQMSMAEAVAPTGLASKTAVNTDTGRIADPNSEPALPTFKLVSIGDCVRTPGVKHKRSKLCLPEIPQQLGCFLRELVEDIYGGFYELRYCDYEYKCAEMGFCLQERPDDVFEVLIFATNLDLFINLCWLQNSLVWIMSVLFLLFPIVDALLEVANTYVPMLYLITDPIINATPKTASLNQYVYCLPVFSYSIAFLAALLFVTFVFVWPLISWFIRTITRLWTLVEAFRAVIQSAATMAQSDPVNIAFNADPDTVRRQMDSGRFIKPRTRRAFKTPGDTMLPPGLDPNSRQRITARIGGSFGVGVPGVNIDVEPLSAQYEEHPDADTPMSADDEEAISLMIECNTLGYELCGMPDPDVTLEDLVVFERRWAPMLQSIHMSWTWARRYLKRSEKEQKKASNTELPIVSFWKGHYTEPGSI